MAKASPKTKPAAVDEVDFGTFDPADVQVVK